MDYNRYEELLTKVLSMRWEDLGKPSKDKPVVKVKVMLRWRFKPKEVIWVYFSTPEEYCAKMAYLRSRMYLDELEIGEMIKVV